MTSSSVSVIANTLARLLRDTHALVLLKLIIIKVLKRPRGRPVGCVDNIKDLRAALFRQSHVLAAPTPGALRSPAFPHRVHMQ